ncbi:hypothetical protein BKA80DRAFT_41331 [Phyllosticta citrichinensis]
MFGGFDFDLREKPRDPTLVLPTGLPVERILARCAYSSFAGLKASPWTSVTCALSVSGRPVASSAFVALLSAGDCSPSILIRPHSASIFASRALSSAYFLLGSLYFSTSSASRSSGFWVSVHVNDGRQGYCQTTFDFRSGEPWRRLLFGFG